MSPEVPRTKADRATMRKAQGLPETVQPSRFLRCQKPLRNQISNNSGLGHSKGAPKHYHVNQERIPCKQTALSERSSPSSHQSVPFNDTAEHSPANSFSFPTLSPDGNQSHSPDRELILLFNQACSQAILLYVLRTSVILANFLLLLFGGMDAHVGDTPPGSLW